MKKIISNSVILFVVSASRMLRKIRTILETGIRGFRLRHPIDDRQLATYLGKPRRKYQEMEIAKFTVAETLSSHR